MVHEFHVQCLPEQVGCRVVEPEDLTPFMPSPSLASILKDSLHDHSHLRINAVHPITAQSPKQAVSQDFLLKFYVLLRSFSTILATWLIQRNFLNWIPEQRYLTSLYNEIVFMFHPKFFTHFISLRSKCFCEHFVSKQP